MKRSPKATNDDDRIQLIYLIKAVSHEAVKATRFGIWKNQSTTLYHWMDLFGNISTEKESITIWSVGVKSLRGTIGKADIHITTNLQLLGNNINGSSITQQSNQSTTQQDLATGAKQSERKQATTTKH
jgi:hypothetical protein